MPLIDFKCKKCGKDFFEVVKNCNDKVQCPECKSEEVQRVYKGKFYGSGDSCSGNCSECCGCNH